MEVVLLVSELKIWAMGQKEKTYKTIGFAPKTLQNHRFCSKNPTKPQVLNDFGLFFLLRLRFFGVFFLQDPELENDVEDASTFRSKRCRSKFESRHQAFDFLWRC